MMEFVGVNIKEDLQYRLYHIWTHDMFGNRVSISHRISNEELSHMYQQTRNLIIDDIIKDASSKVISEAYRSGAGPS